MRVLAAAVFVAAVASAALAVENCKVFDPVNGEQYDLNPLGKTTGNYIVSTAYANGDPQYKYLLNICRPLNANTVTTTSGDVKSCPTTWEVCQVDVKYSDSEPKNLGTYGGVVVPVVLARGQLMLNYTSGDLCNRLQKARTTTVLLECDPSAGMGQPVFAAETSCTYVFKWKTSAACGVKVTPPSSTPPRNCEVVDNAAKLRYDLTALSKSSGNWIIYDDDYQYALNVCRDLNGLSQCGSGSGACQLKPSDSSFAKSLGMSSARPTLTADGVLTLQMTGGKACHGGTVTRTATIVFECLPGEGLGKPVFVDETDDCEYIFSWASAAACGEPTGEARPCTVKDSKTQMKYDLTSLALPKSAAKNYVISSLVAEDVRYQYKMNVCNSLASADNDCRDGVAICQADPSGDQAPRSLGSVASLAVVDGNVVATYMDGDRCEDTGGRVTTVVYYTCDPTAGVGTPRLITAIDDCEYIITWRTASACPSDYVAPTGFVDPGTSGSGPNIALIVMLVLLSLVVLYFAVGTLYNRSKGLKGFDQVPHWDLFQAAYYTVLESCSRGQSSSGGGAIQL